MSRIRVTKVAILCVVLLKGENKIDRESGGAGRTEEKE